MAECCFSKVSIQGTFREYWPFGTDLYARLLYIKAGNNDVLMMALDGGDTTRPATAQFRKEVAAATGIDPDHIWFHELQIHAGPAGDVLIGETISAIARRVADEVNAMKERMTPFTCEVTEAYAGTEFSYNREQYVHGLGGVTVWAGMKYDEHGKPYLQDPSRMLLRGYKPDLPAFDKPIYFDNPNDPLAYLFVFKDTDGTILGTVSRFAAHPDIAVLFESHGVEDYKFNFDWPGYLCETMEREYGAPAMYLNGPCANLAMKKGFDGITTYDASAAEAKRVGDLLAAFLIDARKKKVTPLGNPDNCRTARYEIQLPINEVLPRSHADMTDEKKQQLIDEAETALQQALSGNRPAHEIKSLIDKRFRANNIPNFLTRACLFDDEVLSSRTAPVDFNVLQLGDYLFMGIPGESMVEMTHWMRSTFTGAKTVTLDQVNGYYSYMATPTSLTLGGYTYWYSWVGRDAIPTLKEGIVDAMDAFLSRT